MSNVPMTRPEEALAIHDMQCGHGSTFVGLEGGRILLSAGVFRISDDGGITWGEWYQGNDQNGESVTGQCLVNLAGGAIGLTGRRRRPGSSNPHNKELAFRRSEDEGKTWSPPVVMNQGLLRAYAHQDMMIRTESGRLVPTQLAGTHAPGQIRRLPETGHLMVVWTQQSQREIRQGFIRTRLSTAISRNGGGIWEHFQNVESLHEEMHVEPGPIENVRPEGCYQTDRRAAVECDPEYVVPLPEGYGCWSYPSAYVAEDRVLIAHTYTVHDSRTTENVTPPNSSKLKVLPISWFYGGDDPQRESTVLKKIATLPPRP